MRRENWIVGKPLGNGDPSDERMVVRFVWLDRSGMLGYARFVSGHVLGPRTVGYVSRQARPRLPPGTGRLAFGKIGFQVGWPRRCVVIRKGLNFNGLIGKFGYKKPRFLSESGVHTERLMSVVM